MNTKLQVPDGMKIVDVVVTRTVKAQLWVNDSPEAAKQSAHNWAKGEGDESFRCGDYTQEIEFFDLVPVGESAGARLSRDSDVAGVAR